MTNKLAPGCCCGSCEIRQYQLWPDFYSPADFRCFMRQTITYTDHAVTEVVEVVYTDGVGEETIESTNSVSGVPYDVTDNEVAVDVMAAGRFESELSPTISGLSERVDSATPTDVTIEPDPYVDGVIRLTRTYTRTTAIVNREYRLALKFDVSNQFGFGVQIPGYPSVPTLWPAVDRSKIVSSHLQILYRTITPDIAGGNTIGVDTTQLTLHGKWTDSDLPIDGDAFDALIGNAEHSANDTGETIGTNDWRPDVTEWLPDDDTDSITVLLDSITARTGAEIVGVKWSMVDRENPSDGEWHSNVTAVYDWQRDFVREDAGQFKKSFSVKKRDLRIDLSDTVRAAFAGITTRQALLHYRPGAPSTNLYPVPFWEGLPKLNLFLDEIGEPIEIGYSFGTVFENRASIGNQYSQVMAAWVETANMTEEFESGMFPNLPIYLNYRTRLECRHGDQVISLGEHQFRIPYGSGSSGQLGNYYAQTLVGLVPPDVLLEIGQRYVSIGNTQTSHDDSDVETSGYSIDMLTGEIDYSTSPLTVTAEFRSNPYSVATRSERNRVALPGMTADREEFDLTIAAVPDTLNFGSISTSQLSKVCEEASLCDPRVCNRTVSQTPILHADALWSDSPLPVDSRSQTACNYTSGRSLMAALNSFENLFLYFGERDFSGLRFERLTWDSGWDSIYSPFVPPGETYVSRGYNSPAEIKHFFERQLSKAPQIRTNSRQWIAKRIHDAYRADEWATYWPDSEEEIPDQNSIALQHGTSNDVGSVLTIRHLAGGNGDFSRGDSFPFGLGQSIFYLGDRIGFPTQSDNLPPKIYRTETPHYLLSVKIDELSDEELASGKSCDQWIAVQAVLSLSLPTPTGVEYADAVDNWPIVDQFGSQSDIEVELIPGYPPDGYERRFSRASCELPYTDLRSPQPYEMQPYFSDDSYLNGNVWVECEVAGLRTPSLTFRRTIRRDDLPTSITLNADDVIAESGWGDGQIDWAYSIIPELIRIPPNNGFSYANKNLRVQELSLTHGPVHPQAKLATPRDAIYYVGLFKSLAIAKSQFTVAVDLH